MQFRSTVRQSALDGMKSSQQLLKQQKAGSSVDGDRAAEEASRKLLVDACKDVLKQCDAIRNTVGPSLGFTITDTKNTSVWRQR